MHSPRYCRKQMSRIGVLFSLHSLPLSSPLLSALTESHYTRLCICGVCTRHCYGVPPQETQSHLTAPDMQIKVIFNLQHQRFTNCNLQIRDYDTPIVEGMYHFRSVQVHREATLCKSSLRGRETVAQHMSDMLTRGRASASLSLILLY